MTEPEETETFESAILENIALGYVEIVGIDDNGQFFYQLTDAGKAHVESMLKGG